MAKFFIDRPIFAIVLSIIITIIGVTAAFSLPVAQYPQISPPTVSISTSYQGANADVVDQTVAQVIEQQVNGVEGMSSMASTSTDSGSYSLTVQFESGKDSDTAAVQTQNRVSEANASLPTSVQTTGITTRKASQDMSMIFNLYSPDDTYDVNFLKNYGSIYFLDDIKRVKGVGDVSAFGSDYSMRIWLQPEKMAELAISTSEVTSAIEKQNVQAAAGSLGKMPVASDQEFQYTARVKGRLSSAKEFENIIIRSNSDGSAVYIKDVARVEFGSKEYTYDSLINGHQSAGFAIQLTSDANALETIGNVKKVLEEASKNFPVGLQYKIVVDNTNFVRQSMIEVGKTFAEALLLVVIVVFLFLQSWRATLIPTLAIPVSLLGTFGAFSALGFTINTLTLFAMVLAIGLVVDDAIVVIEAVEHHMRYSGLTPLEATKRAMSEVSGPVVAIAFVLASVFIPVAFFGGMMGILYKQFAITIAVSMALSAVVALSLTPALCVLLLKPYDPNSHKGAVGRFFDKFNDCFDRAIEKYGAGLAKIIGKARLCMVLLLIVFILIGVLYKLVPTSFVPDEDQGFYMTSLTLPEASSLNRTISAMKGLTQTVSSQGGVVNVMSLSGMDMLGGGTKPNAGAMFISLAPWEERKDAQLQVKAEIAQTFMSGAQLPEGTVISFAPPALPGLGMVGGYSFMLEDRSGGSLDDLDSISQKFVAAAQQRPEIGSIASNFKANTPGYEFEVDRAKAEKMGVDVDDVFTTLQIFLGGSQVNDFNKFGRTYKVTVQADAAFRSDENAMRYLFVKSSNDTMVPLNTLVKPKKVSAPSVITRYNGVKSVKISGSQAAGYSSGQAMTALEEVAAEVLPDGYTYEWSGQSREEKLSGDRAPIVFGMAMVFAFLCLAALYESWSVPFAVLLTVPVGIFGAFLFQYARNLENSVYMQIGLVMLIGLAAKNAILIVEFAKVRVDKGMDPVQAAIESAKIRLRPILMTSLAFIIGCFPLAIATGAGAGARNSMGTAVVGGMFTATTLGIFLIPVLFVVIEKIAMRKKA
ncbi:MULTISPECIES: efflux RND transporter permease subunit [Pelosinus]|uniref:Transporter, hydrophobe/amphiphile efflux-1 (HAE1) family n=1 Tax=Pelosinus fermentans B4 TaxID=1149862 RepID=I8R9Q4_9FIRM|nr:MULTISPECIES: multidrug efflux RND transporter permease subunit [Pelosinus]EIW15523.1 transporter, hydrophobe/amphiphile efflux-1 (HAE1) family [Pelosinus fermentans B4]EIW26787.1 transporter, hydrophobe/amphiphile efflux-1 (HAE1) family [Pelosinus fermentans A11]OAM92267.1 transporter, hydrophobe/amphiphile efflux-1 (HAE1) family [Pelosinus fermentans DSM 17108]SDQ38967.1 hydrophobe/amphiphile efflux-1 (HAE1) family protein [Pelosinus fermentans]